jgi:hypothetical protein
MMQAMEGVCPGPGWPSAGYRPDTKIEKVNGCFLNPPTTLIKAYINNQVLKQKWVFDDSIS